MRKLFCLVALVALAPAATARAGSVTGLWDATVEVAGQRIPFLLEISGDGPQLAGAFLNGDQRDSSTTGRREGDSIVLDFGHYLTKIEATLKGGELEGKVEGRYSLDRYTEALPFHAKRHVPSRETAAADLPIIDGLWEIPFDSAKGEKSWRFIVKQAGAKVAASILRIDGDTGTLGGTYKDGKFVVSHFSPSHPYLLEITPAKDGTLAIAAKGNPYTGPSKLTAYRPADARKRGLPEPADFNKHTSVNDPKKPFQFSFPDVAGKTISNTDPRFKDRVVVAVVTGTWCPNCHDEARFLVELHKKYRDRGLEVIALDFEEIEQQDDLARVKAFVKKYGVEYPYLIAGAPVEMWQKVPQAVNLNSWPTTFFVGRDGLVKRIHAGFPSSASGEFERQVKEEFTSTVEQLLAERSTASR